MCGKYPKNPVVGGCRQLLCWGLPQQGRAQLATSAPSPFLWLLVSSTLGVVFFPRNSLAWSLERPKLGGKALLTLAFPGSKPPVCHSAFKPRRFSGMSLQGLFVPFPVPCVPSFTHASGCRGATLELQDSVVGGQGVLRRRRRGQCCLSRAFPTSSPEVRRQQHLWGDAALAN